jgi:hypothetical protein
LVFGGLSEIFFADLMGKVLVVTKNIWGTGWKLKTKFYIDGDIVLQFD